MVFLHRWFSFDDHREDVMADYFDQISHHVSHFKDILFPEFYESQFSYRQRAGTLYATRT